MTALYKPRPERWPRFSLRSGFLLVAIVAAFAGWVHRQRNWLQQRQEAMGWISSVADVHVPAVECGFKDNTPWNLRLFGHCGLIGISLRRELLPSDPYTRDELRSLFPEAEIKSENDLSDSERLELSEIRLMLKDETEAQADRVH